MKHFFTFSLLFLCCAFGVQSQVSNLTLNHDGTDRDFIVYLPSGYQAGAEFPVVFVLHGLGDNANNMMNTGFNSLADDQGFIPVYPQGLVDPFLGASAWNNGLNPFSTVDDMGFMDTLVGYMNANYSVNASRIYATGFSMGGFMCQAIACEMSDRFTAIASVGGTLPDVYAADCQANRPVPLMHIHGTGDATVEWGGSDLLGYAGVDETMAFWSSLDLCAADPDTTHLPDIANDSMTVDKILYTGCDQEAEVVLMKVFNADHWWLTTGTDINYTEEIWDFFNRNMMTDTFEVVQNDLLLVGSDIVLFPNPSQDVFIIRHENTVLKSVEVLDMQGRIVQEIQGNELIGSETEVHVSELCNGLYMVKINTGSAIISRRLMKK